MSDASCGNEAGKRVWVIRYAWERVGVVSGLVLGELLLAESERGSDRAGYGVEPGETRRRLELHRADLPVGGPARESARLPLRRPGLPPCEDLQLTALSQKKGGAALERCDSPREHLYHDK